LKNPQQKSIQFGLIVAKDSFKTKIDVEFFSGYHSDSRLFERKSSLGNYQEKVNLIQEQIKTSSLNGD